MHIPLKDSKPTAEILIEELKQKRPDYRFKPLGSTIIIARKSFLSGAVIFVKTKKITVSGNFPEFYQSLIFAVLVVLSGILIPLILYFIFIRKKFRTAEKEIAGAIIQILENSAKN